MDKCPVDDPRGMVWSYSRARSFEDCPYRWFLRYIKSPPEAPRDTFFASYGHFLHGLLDSWYKSPPEAKPDLRLAYLTRFREEVRGTPPSEKVFETYFKDGLSYVSGFKPFPFRPIGTEVEVRYTLDGLPMRGFLDFLGRGEDGSLALVDHKSRALRPRSRRAAPTKNDLELDAYFRQLYLYAPAVEQTFGEKPKTLCLNCFRTGSLITEPFDPSAFDRAKSWFFSCVDRASHERDFPPRPEWFKCNFLCEYAADCEYFNLIK